jgi:hypothetical protein
MGLCARSAAKERTMSQHQPAKPATQDNAKADVVPLHPPKTDKEKKRLDKELDKALADSFPASDPPSSSQPTGTEPAGDPRVKP